MMSEADAMESLRELYANDPEALTVLDDLESDWAAQHHMEDDA